MQVVIEDSTMAGPGERELRKAAEQMWSALDDLAERNPEEYKRFIDQQLKEGAGAQQNAQPVFCLQCDAKLRVNYSAMVECNRKLHGR